MVFAFCFLFKKAHLNLSSQDIILSFLLVLLIILKFISLMYIEFVSGTV